MLFPQASGKVLLSTRTRLLNFQLSRKAENVPHVLPVQVLVRTTEDTSPSSALVSSRINKRRAAGSPLAEHCSISSFRGLNMT